MKRYALPLLLWALLACAPAAGQDALLTEPLAGEDAGAETGSSITIDQALAAAEDTSMTRERIAELGPGIPVIVVPLSQLAPGESDAGVDAVRQAATTRGAWLAHLRSAARGNEAIATALADAGLQPNSVVGVAIDDGRLLVFADDGVVVLPE